MHTTLKVFTIHKIHKVVHNIPYKRNMGCVPCFKLKVLFMLCTRTHTHIQMNFEASDSLQIHKSKWKWENSCLPFDFFVRYFMRMANIELDGEYLAFGKMLKISYFVTFPLKLSIFFFNYCYCYLRNVLPLQRLHSRYLSFTSLKLYVCMRIAYSALLCIAWCVGVCVYVDDCCWGAREDWFRFCNVLIRYNA